MRPFHAVLALALLLAAGCGGDDPTGPGDLPGVVDLSEPWRASTPEAEGIDPAGLAEAVDSAAELGFVRALLVARNGRLVEESYFGNDNERTVFDVHSVTKTVTGLLVGMAVDDGALDVEDLMVDWLPADDVRAEHGGIRVRHLLTMTSGIQWSEEEDLRPWIESGRPVGYVLDRPVVAEPGEQFTYSSGNSHLLSAIVAAATGGDGLAFAEERLLGPLGITEGNWITFGGQPLGGFGLRMPARDMARLGQLVLQRGRSGSRTLVSERWIDEAFSEQVIPGGSDGVLDGEGYGYQVWTARTNPRSLVMIGFGGQFVWMVPELDLMVVATTRWSTSRPEESQEQTGLLAALIRDLVIPSVEGP
ncbi:MAG: serine hydrolase [Gemmatimonadota bacterium]|jgi:CubicO group peptidase (beta-lactamase class C family)